MRIAVIGGGIVGLTTTLSLHKVGLHAEVYEAVASPAPLGVGINLLPHATRELAELDLLEEIVALGVPITELVYRLGNGLEVWREPRGLAAGYDWPQVAIHRGRLQMFLIAKVQAALGRDAIRFGHALDRIEMTSGGAKLQFLDRKTQEAVATIETDVVIGADGIHSAVRRHFYPEEGRPKWNGLSLYRGATWLAPGSTSAVMNWTGHSKQKFVGYPIAIDPATKRMLFNWICDLPTGSPGDTPPEDWNRVVDPQAWLWRYADWRWPGVDVQAIIGQSSSVYEFPMVDRDPLPRWSFDRITLAGDAAHPMYPIGSNGATQGIIDARSLAFHLATESSLTTALEHYEQDRRAATTRIVLTNRAQGPDQVLEIAHSRMTEGTKNLETVFPIDERRRIADGYKVIAGFDPAGLRSRRGYTPVAQAIR